MTPERWQQVENVLQATLDRPPPERASFLELACGGDEELRDEASALVNAYDEAGDFIEQPALTHDAAVLVGNQLQETNIGREIGPYTIVDRLGAGGMGEVFLAQDNRLNRLVALKILPAYFASDDARLRRFQREAQAASALNHPNILTIHEVGEAEDLRFIATEFIDGETIRALVKAETLSLDEVLDITEQVASALCAAHAAGIVHRDLKPENIMRRTDGLVKLLDFGIAKLVEQASPEPAGNSSIIKTHTEIGIVMGTAGYMSPEQARGLPVDERTDIWSLGIVLYEMLAHHLPFQGATRMDTMVGILEREPAPLSQVAMQIYPGSVLLQAVIERCLRKDRTERYQTAAALLAHLKTVRQQINTPVLPGPGRQIAQKGLSGRQYATIALVAALLLAAIAGTMIYRRSAARQKANLANAAAGIGATSKAYAQMNEGEQLRFIVEQEQRISLMMGDHPGKLNEEAVRAIKRHLDRYLARNGDANLGDASLSAIYGRARFYAPLITRSFAARKVPVIIGIYLPVVESAYRNCYENDIGAKGLFQFLPQTAAHYGVAHGDMCEVEKMAPAAAHYIADRMAELGEDSESMTLVLLSYNRGPESVREMLRQVRGADNYERNFWTLFTHRHQLDETFRNENAWYVPNFFAAAIIGENPERFGLDLPPLSTLSVSPAP